jgi:hypothetical protein
MEEIIILYNRNNAELSRNAFYASQYIVYVMVINVSFHGFKLSNPSVMGRSILLCNNM